MTIKTTAEKIYTAYLTGDEAEFYSNGIRYEFTPDGLKSFISSGTFSVFWGNITDKPTTFPPTAGVAVVDAVDETDVVTQFNALLASLRASGAIAT